DAYEVVLVREGDGPAGGLLGPALRVLDAVAGVAVVECEKHLVVGDVTGRGRPSFRRQRRRGSAPAAARPRVCPSSGGGPAGRSRPSRPGGSRFVARGATRRRAESDGGDAGHNQA